MGVEDAQFCPLHSEKVSQFSREVGDMAENVRDMDERLRDVEKCTAVLTANQTTLTTVVEELKTIIGNMSNKKTDFLWSIAQGVMTALILYALVRGGGIGG